MKNSVHLIHIGNPDDMKVRWSCSSMCRRHASFPGDVLGVSGKTYRRFAVVQRHPSNSNLRRRPISMARNRPFNRDNLMAVAGWDIRPPMGICALVWRYVVFLPLSEQKLGDEDVATIADAEDINNLRAMLSDHFGGVTILLPVMGQMDRDPNDPTSLELNRNLPFLIYAKPVAASDRYFDRLERELRESNEGVILVSNDRRLFFSHPPKGSPQQCANGPVRNEDWVNDAQGQMPACVKHFSIRTPCITSGSWSVAKSRKAFQPAAVAVWPPV